MTTEKHILPADDPEVSDLVSDIIETLGDALEGYLEIAPSSETGEPVIDLWRGELGGTRRFRLELVEIL